MDIEQLGLSVDLEAKVSNFERGIAKAVANLDQFSAAGTKAENAAKSFGARSHVLAGAAERAAKETAGVTGAMNANARAAAVAGSAARAANENIQRSGGLARHEMINLSRQAQDVFVSLASGQSPFTVLAQQGTQIADVFATSRGTLSGFAAQIAAMITPTRLAVVGIVGLGAAAYGLYSLLRTEQPTANQLMEEHGRLLGIVKDAYRSAKDSAGEFYEQSKAITELQARQSLLGLQQQLRQASSAAIKPLTLPSELPEISYATGSDARFATTQYRELNQAIDAFNNSVKDAGAVNAFRDAVAGIGLAAQSTNPDLAKQAAEIVKNTTELGNLAKAAADTERMLRFLTGQATNSDRKALGLTPRDQNEGIRLEQQRLSLLGEAATATERLRLIELSVIEARRKPGSLVTDTDVKRIMDYARESENLRRQQESVSVLGSAATEAERYAVTLADLNMRLKYNKISQDDFNRSVVAAHPLFEPLKSAASEFATGFVHDLRAGASAMESLTNAVVRLSDRLIDLALNQAINSLFANLARGLGGGLMGTIGGTGLPGFGGLYADGGMLARGRWGIVGERGPELIAAHSGGGVSIYPNSVTREMMSVLPGFADGGSIDSYGMRPGVLVGKSAGKGRVLQ